jgi:CheY-like chemotaxis protein
VLNVESKPGQGTAFALYLPKHYSDKDQPVINRTVMTANGRKKILFVDDEPALVFAGKKMLEKLGYEVVAGTDSRNALDVFRAQPASFDLMITDQTMPHMTGDMLAREVLKVRSDMPIILCSGNNPSESYCLPLEKARAIGIKEFLTKPYERSEMSQVIHRILN